MEDIDTIRTREGDPATRMSDSGGNADRGADPGADGSAEIHWIPIADLVLADSPRTAGTDERHTRMLAESGLDLPPILVQRDTKRVVDGVHRVRAAELRGERAIRARLFDGDDESAFVMAVRLNSGHGLPLTLADRKEAARRVLRTRAAWSNRAIASLTGLSHKTVAALREGEGVARVQARVGRDGRTRPLSTASGRERAREVLQRDPTLSLRDVSAIAGVSPGTVRAVRDRLSHGVESVIPSPRSATPAPPPTAAREDGAVRPRERPVDPEAVLRVLRADPSLRLTQSGRLLLSILAVASMDTGAHERLVVDLPDHCVGRVAELAAASVLAWQELATRLDERRSTPARPDCPPHSPELSERVVADGSEPATN